MSKWDQSDLRMGNIHYWFFSHLNLPQVRKERGCPLTSFLNSDHVFIYLFVSSTSISWVHATCWTLRLQSWCGLKVHDPKGCLERLKYQTPSPWRYGCSVCWARTQGDAGAEREPKQFIHHPTILLIGPTTPFSSQVGPTGSIHQGLSRKL